MEDYGLISVIIPVYNVEQYLTQCVDSVLAQTYQNIEIILVDDGSTDYSGHICDEYLNIDERIKIVHQENAGLSEARNNGFNVSNGLFVAFIDSDDWITSRFIEYLVCEIVNTNADFAFCDAKCFEDSPKAYNILQSYIREKKYDSGSGLEVFKELQTHKDFHCAVQMYLWKRDFIEKNGLKFYPGILYEDMIYTFKAFLLAECVSHCHIELYHRRFRKNSIVTSRPNKRNFMSACIVYYSVCDSLRLYLDDCIREYCTRCAFKAINIFKDLAMHERRDCRDRYIELRRKIIENQYHNSLSLKILINNGKPIYFLYKGLKKGLGLYDKIDM